MVGLAVAAGAGPQSVDAIDLGGVEFGSGNRNRFDIPPEDNPDGLRSPRPLAYRIEYTDPPTTVPFTKDLEVCLCCRCLAACAKFAARRSEALGVRCSAYRRVGVVLQI